MTVQPVFIRAQDAFEFTRSLPNLFADLIVIDPPYYGIVDDEWDNQWSSPAHYVEWISDLANAYKRVMSPRASLIVFGGIGKHGEHPFFDSIKSIERIFQFRNLITWGKRRGYGKTHDYLFCREEFAWFSKSKERTEVTFNIPLLSEKRGYAGFNPAYPAKSEYKRVTNVWSDIPELMRPERTAQKPVPLLNRIIETHSNPGDTVIDTFCGWGTTGVSSVGLRRDFLGCEIIAADAALANERVIAAAKKMEEDK